MPYKDPEKRRASQGAYQKAYQRSEKGRATKKAYMKSYRRSEKGRAYQKAYMKAYQKSEKRRAYQKSEKGRAYQRSEKGRAYQKSYRLTGPMRPEREVQWLRKSLHINRMSGRVVRKLSAGVSLSTIEAQLITSHSTKPTGTP